MAAITTYNSEDTIGNSAKLTKVHRWENSLVRKALRMKRGQWDQATYLKQSAHKLNSLRWQYGCERCAARILKAHCQTTWRTHREAPQSNALYNVHRIRKHKT